MTRYTVGFAFSLDGSHVALIRKLRPKWQNGKLNGIGGHVEPEDGHPAATQQREFWEETGVIIPANQWLAFATLVGPDYMVRCFRTLTDDIYKVRSMTDEEIVVLPVSALRDQLHIVNLGYLLPLALDNEQIGVPIFHYQPR